MTMKKILMTLAAVLCCAMTTTVFTACGGDDGNNTPPAQPKVESYQIDYSLEFPKEFTLNSVVCGNLYLLCDKIEVGYIDENGQEQREVINNGKWSKSVTYTYKKNLETYLMLYLTKPASIDKSSLTYDQYADLVNIMPTQLAGITTFYDNGKSEKSPIATFSFNAKDTSNPWGKNKVPEIFDIVIKPEEQVLHIQYLN
jgi:hypothetical protein